MRFFWIVIAVFMIFAAFIAWAQMDPARSGETLAVNGQSLADASQPVESRQPRFGAPIELDAPADGPADEVNGADTIPDTSMIDELAREAREQASINEDELAELDEAQKLADELFDSAMGGRTKTPDGEINGLPDDADDRPAPPTSLDLKQNHQHQPDQLQNPENPWELAAKNAEERQPLEHSIRERSDGVIVLDETFEVKGKGTASQPYEVTWDLLLSAAETYQPRLGMTHIPERIQMLDGKYVKISGNLLFPMVGVDAREVLVMLNMWDGCCLGTMPSPYDAIEVQLAQPVRANNRNFMNYGTLEGKLTIDPYLINDWLLGLYVMEDAQLNIGM